MTADWEAVLYMIFVTWAMIAAGVLVFFHDFDDKVVGRIGLACILVACAGVLHDAYSGGAFAVLRTTLLFTGGVALFLTRMVCSHFGWWKEHARHSRLF
jgi:hypothetical protein